MADRAKQQQAQGLRCSDCGAEGKLIVCASHATRQTSRTEKKREADRRAAVEEYMAAAKEDAKANKQKCALYLGLRYEVKWLTADCVRIDVVETPVQHEKKKAACPRVRFRRH
jgi:hypothetical protein